MFAASGQGFGWGRHEFAELLLSIISPTIKLKVYTFWGL